jgi:hypothetical protein
MQSEAAHAVEMTKLVEFVKRKVDSLIEFVRLHRHNIEGTANRPDG